MRDSLGPGNGGFHPFNGRVSRVFEGGPSASPGAPYLSYHGILQPREDVDPRRSPGWVADNVIGFWEEYLERSVLARETEAHVVLLRPSMAFLLMQTRDADVLGLAEALPKLEHATHVFCPVNDCRNPAVAEGGSHWSLLLVSIIDRTAFHYDSLSSANLKDAEMLTRKLQRLLGFPLAFRDLPNSPQQENGSDCGVFVCASMEHLLLDRLLKSKRHEKSSMSMASTDIDAGAMRKKMYKVIEKFRREGERRRS